MIGTWLMGLCVAADVLLLLGGWRAYSWRNRGTGVRSARIEYARILRECPDTAEARLSENEFIRHRVASRPGATPWLVCALLVVLVGLPVAYVIGLIAT
ncbi:MAG: hypothetical protein ACREPY_00215 [Rhodanobacteraceae bacterium]